MEKRDVMGSTPVKKLMLSMGIPIILSMVLQAVYNIVDSAFVANMHENGEAALTALTLAFPFQMLMVAIGIGTGVGVNALVSKSLGQGDREKASRAAGNATFMGIIIYVVFLLFGLFGVRTYITSQTDNALIAAMAVDYLQICCVASIGIVFFAIYEKLLQASGHSVCSTIAQITGAVLNIVLDPIMIYGLLGCPEFGVKGAAYATVIGQIASCVVGFVFHIKVNTQISNSLKYMKPSLNTIKSIYAIGLPAIIAQALMSVMTYGLNIVLGGVSEALVTAYGLYYKIQQFILFAAFGLRDAITPIVSYSHGMGNKERIRDGVKYGMIFTLVIMVAGLVIIEAFAVPFSSLFGLSGETQALCISAMRIVSISFIFAGINIAFQGVFQALNGGIESRVVSLCRQLVFIFPFAWFFAGIAKENAEYMWTIWTTFPIAELLSAVIAVILFNRIYKRI
jgi:putative MATE family efflux protein